MFRNRWVRRLAVTLPVVLILLVGGWFYFRHKTQQHGLARVEAASRQLDADDPRWRFDDIDADRGSLPDDQNGALLIPRLKTALAGNTINPFRPDKTNAFDNVPVNHRLDDEGAEAIDQALLGADAGIAVAREFRHYPHGLRRYRISPDVVGTLLPEVQETRTAVHVLTLEAERLARDGRPGAALQLVPAMLNAGRSLNGEPFLISALVRISCAAIAVRRAERTLALGVPSGGLAEIQAALLREAEADVFWGPLRGERALMDRLFTNLRAGVVPPSTILALAGDLGGPRLPPPHLAWAADVAYRPFIPNDHAVCLETMTQMYAIRGLPEHQQRAAFKAVPVPPAGPGTHITHLLLPSMGKLHDASLRHKANLRCAGTALAVERFRQANGRWPDSLAEMPRDLLRAVPLDPFDGQPVKYARRPDGVTIYSIGADETDNGGAVTDRPSTTEPGKDLGFRLFDVEQRGHPPAARPDHPAPGPGAEPPAGVDLPEPGILVAPTPREVAQPDR